MQKELSDLNEKTKQAFENAFDISEDYNWADIDQYQSGVFKNDDESVKQTYFSKLMQKGPVSFELILTLLIRSLNCWSQRLGLTSISHRTPSQTCESTARPIAMALTKPG